MIETKELHNEFLSEDLIRKYGGENGGAPEIGRKQRVCDGCYSKLYAGDTVYIIDRFCYCSECVEETEYDDDCCG
ncbi:MAG: hypothetical protein LBL87_07320 [Ruminococcus sp.]|jgi:hypothetical protein|nr:hypothetical protein [Ruminococcus sp.]